MSESEPPKDKLVSEEGAPSETHRDGGVTASDHSPDVAVGHARENTPCPVPVSSTQASSAIRGFDDLLRAREKHLARVIDTDDKAKKGVVER